MEDRYWYQVRSDYLKDFQNDKAEILPDFFGSDLSEFINKFIEIPEKIKDLLQREEKILNNHFENLAQVPTKMIYHFASPERVGIILSSNQEEKIKKIYQSITNLQKEVLSPPFDFGEFLPFEYTVVDPEIDLASLRGSINGPKLKLSLEEILSDGINVEVSDDFGRFENNFELLLGMLNFKYRMGDFNETNKYILLNLIGVNSEDDFGIFSVNREESVNKLYNFILNLSSKI